MANQSRSKSLRAKAVCLDRPDDVVSKVSELTKQPVSSRLASIPSDLRPSWEIVISFLIDDVSRLQRAALDQLFKPLGASRAQWALMAHAARHPGLKQTELADGLDL